jgi:hypothetical protein
MAIMTMGKVTCGFCRMLVMDNGLCFVNEEFWRRMTSRQPHSYHPTTNGLAERAVHANSKT